MISGSGGKVEDDAGDDLTQDEVFEEKLRETIDLATQKSANGKQIFPEIVLGTTVQLIFSRVFPIKLLGMYIFDLGRVEALNGLCRAFGKKFVPEFVDNRKITIQDIIERSLKKGKGSEQIAAANLATSLCIQLRGDADDLYREIKPILITLMTDTSASVLARISAATSLGNLCFLAAPAIVEVEAVMVVLEQTFTSPSSHTGDTLSLCTAALSAWTLLATVLPMSRVHDLLVKHAELFGKLLDAPDVDLRIATGEAIAVLYEFLSESEENDSDEEDLNVGDNRSKEELERVVIAIDNLVPHLKQLATDSQKSRSKKDRKEQKASFRDILRTVEEGDGYYEKVAINKREKLEIESWAMKKQYEMVCKVRFCLDEYHILRIIISTEITLN